MGGDDEGLVWMGLLIWEVCFLLVGVVCISGCVVVEEVLVVGVVVEDVEGLEDERWWSPAPLRWRTCLRRLRMGIVFC